MLDVIHDECLVKIFEMHARCFGGIDLYIVSFVNFDALPSWCLVI